MTTRSKLYEAADAALTIALEVQPRRWFVTRRACKTACDRLGDLIRHGDKHAPPDAAELKFARRIRNGLRDLCARMPTRMHRDRVIRDALQGLDEAIKRAETIAAIGPAKLRTPRQPQRQLSSLGSGLHVGGWHAGGWKA